MNGKDIRKVNYKETTKQKSKLDRLKTQWQCLYPFGIKIDLYTHIYYYGCH